MPSAAFRYVVMTACLVQAGHAVPTGSNLGFESGLTGWTTANVAIETMKVHSGIRSLSLRNGFIEQTLTGMVPGSLHTLSLAYRDNTPESWLLSHARIRIDGTVIGEIHNGQSTEYLSSGAIEFAPANGSATLRIESLTSGMTGLLLDAIGIASGGLPAPPEHAWSSLAVIGDTRGGRRLVNGGFESATSNPATDPHNSGPAGNPHLWGLSLPGWRVTRENVDLIESSAANPPEGTKALDANGHGPGGIAQTIAGLQPGAAYTVSFRYARHTSWGTGDMTGEIFANGLRVASLVRSSAQTWNSGYALKEIPVLASPGGKLTIEIRSTVTDQGGGIVYDDIRLKQGGDGFTAWAVLHGVTALGGADDDHDGLTHDLEFLLGSDPAAPGGGRLPVFHAATKTLSLPLAGLALSQGYAHTLESSRDLESWQAATQPGSGMTLVSDTAAPGVDGERTYLIGAAEPSMFWRHRYTTP